MNWTLVGLGNPGTKYQLTRHNAGFIILNFLHDKFGCSDWKKKMFSNATVSTCDLGDDTMTLVKPETFMNLSGRAVQKYIKTKDDLNHLIVIHDDIYLEIGTFKISVSRGDGGHNGITSLIQTLKSKDFIRIRVGIAPKKNTDEQYQKIKLDQYVLLNFSVTERDELQKLSEVIEKAIISIISEGVEQTMNFYNTK